MKSVAENSLRKNGKGYTIERDKYFYGMNESMQPWSFTQDPGNTPEMTAKLAGALKLQSYRFRMEFRLKDDVIRVGENNCIGPGANVDKFHTWLKLLKDQGINNFLAQTTYFPKPLGYIDDNSINYPAPGSEHYDAFLNMLEETYALAAKEFREISYWEAGNETNEHKYMHPVGGRFDFHVMAQVTTDIMYYANKGVRRGNPDAALVMPGLVFGPDTPMFLSCIYKYIRSGKFPSGGKYAGCGDTDTNNYFDVLNWHPYNFYTDDVSDTSLFMMLNKTLYDIVKANGDNGKKVHLTEYGCTNTYKGVKLRDEVEKAQAHRLVQGLQAVRDNLPFVETVDIFRMFDWEEAAVKLKADSPEIGFGMFTSPGYPANPPLIPCANSDGPKPKLCCVEYYKYRFGQDADLSPLYQFYKPKIN